MCVCVCLSWCAAAVMPDWFLLSVCEANKCFSHSKTKKTKTMTVNQVRHMNKVLTPQFLPSQKVTSVFVVLHLRDAGGQSQLRFSLFCWRHCTLLHVFYVFIWMARLTDIQWWNVTKYTDSSTELKLKFWAPCTLLHYILEANIVLFITLHFCIALE